MNSSLEELLNRWGDRLYRTALAILTNPQDAEDAVQEVFVKLLVRPRNFDSQEHERAWLLRVTVNQCRSHLRWRRRHPSIPIEECLLAATGSMPSVLTSELLSLPPKYRTVLHLYYYEGYSTQEIGRITGKKTSSVRSTLTRGRQMLRQRLDEHGETMEVSL